MNNDSRTRNTVHNFVYSAVAQVISVVLSFASRTVFVKVLNSDYLGINGLFSNIIAIFSLAELGISTAIIFSMYKPIAEGNEKKIAALVRYYKKMYIRIAGIVLVIGLLFFPFLGFFVKLDNDIPELEIYYFIILAQTVFSYLLVYRTSILVADQKSYYLTRIGIVGNICTVAVQIISLLLFENYIIYCSVPIISGLIINWINSKIALKNYPYIDNKVELEEGDRHEIWSNIRAMLTYKIGSMFLNNTDNLLISSIVSTTFLGIYSNYSLIIDKVSGLVNLIFTSLQASLGNYNSNKNPKEMLFMFRVISLIEYWVYSFCSVSFSLLLDDFILIWLGNDFILDKSVIYVCVLNFYIKGVLYPIWCYRNTTGLFKDTKFMMIFASLINLVLSVVLGLRCGIVGILLATAIARICTNVWYEPKVLFRQYFQTDVWKYYCNEIVRFIQLLCLILVSNAFFEVIVINDIAIRILLKTLYCLCIPNVLLFLECFKRPEFKYIIGQRFSR